MDVKRAALCSVLLLSSTGVACGSHRYLYAAPPPPPPRFGAFGAAPGPGYLWADGYWDYRGRGWYWVPGRWARPPRPRAVWVPAHWAPRPPGYVFVPGHWAYARY